MKCTNCQNEFDQTLGCCPVCSAQYNDGAYQAQSTAYQPTAVEIIKKAGSSKLFLIATILYTVAYGLSFIASGEIPTINALMAVGLWMFYAECVKKSANPYAMNTTSFTIMNIAQTIIYVLCWIGAVAFAVCLVLFVSIYGELKSKLGALALLADALIVVFILGIIVFAAEIILRKGIRNYIKSASESAKTGLRPKKLSKLTPMLLIVYSIIGIVSSIVINVVLYLFLDKMIDTLYQFMNSVASLSNTYISVDSSNLNFSISSLSPGFFTVITNIVTSLLPIAAQLAFAYALLDAKKLSDSSYYPTEEELFYQRQAYYYQQQTQNHENYAPTYQQAPYAAQPQYQEFPPEPTADITAQASSASNDPKPDGQ